jgi:surface protein
MFSDCSSLSSFPDISKWNTNNVTNMSYMFNRCSSLSSLPDISKWNTNNVTNMSAMFSGCLNIIISKIITEQFK